MSGKGDTRRPENPQKYAEGWDRTFGKMLMPSPRAPMDLLVYANGDDFPLNQGADSSYIVIHSPRYRPAP